MKKADLTRLTPFTALAAIGVGAVPAFAQDGAAGDAVADYLEEIVVTASGGDKTLLESSVSVTSISADLIDNFQPSSEAEVFRMIPGIQVAGTAGPGGNSNIAVRGLPVATGGSPFVQIQEDGMPTVLFGDIQFGNNDYWTHFDASVANVEGVRGGSSSTYASQAPGAVINYISHTGEVDGGYLALNKGLGFDETKVDFRYGGRLDDNRYYHVGGYVKNGRGPLDAGYTVSNSVQLKGNLTREFDEDKGYLRFYFKYADTQEPNYTGSPAFATISGNQVSNLRPYSNFDGRQDSNYSILNQDFLIVNREGDLERVKMDGITTKAKSLGTRLHYAFSDTVTVDNNLRWTEMSGGFASPFLNTARTSSVIGTTVNGGVVATARYAAGPRAGQVYTGTYLNNNTNVRTNIRDIGSVANDLVLSAKFDVGAGELSARAGWFFMNQRIAMDWHTNAAFSELSGNNPAMLNLFTAAGARLTNEGIAGFNNNWGDCCARDYDLSYANNAPYMALELDNDNFVLDGSVRFDSVKASGWGVSGGPEFMTTVASAAGNVTIPTRIANGTREFLDYTRNYTNWSLGGLWKVSEDFSLFVRSSEGGRFNGDRQTLSGKVNGDGSLNQVGRTASVDFVNQFEVGLKNRGEVLSGNYTVELTLLKGDFKQSTFELSATRCPGGAGGCVIDAKYKSTGAELFATYNSGGFSLVGNATFSKAKQAGAGSNVFSRAVGMPDIIYTFSSNYDFGERVSAGVNVTGQTSAIDDARRVYPAAQTFGAFLRVRPMTNLELGVQAYNLFNKFDLRGNGGVADGTVNPTVIGGAPALGRAITGTVKLSF